MVSLDEITEEFNRLLKQKGLLDEKCGSPAFTVTTAQETAGSVKGFMDDHYKITIKLVDDFINPFKKDGNQYIKWLGKELEKEDFSSYQEKFDKIQQAVADGKLPQYTIESYYPPDYSKESLERAKNFLGITDDFSVDLEQGHKSLGKAVGGWSSAIVDKLDTSLTRDEKSEVHAQADDLLKIYKDYKTDVYHTPVNGAWGFDKDTKFEYMGQLDNGMEAVKVVKGATANPK